MAGDPGDKGAREGGPIVEIYTIATVAMVAAIWFVSGIAWATSWTMDEPAPTWAKLGAILPPLAVATIAILGSLS